MGRVRSNAASLFLWTLVAGLLSQNLVIPVMSSTVQDQKNYYSLPDPHSGSPPGGSHGTPSSPPSHGGGSQSPPSHGGGGSYNPTPSPPSNCGTPPAHHNPTPSHDPRTPSTPSTPSGGGYYYSPPPTYGGSPPTTPEIGTPPTPVILSPPIPVIGTPPAHHNPTPSHDPSTPSTPSTPSGGGYYYSPPPTYGGSPPTTPEIGTPPTPVILSPPIPVIGTPPIDPNTPTIPSPPFLPGPNSLPPFTCNYWGSHPTLIWGLLGWWGTLGNSFGVSSLPGIGSGTMSLPQALSNTRTDGLGELYRQGTAALLNAMVDNRFHFTTNQVRDRFVSALGSNKAAATQARVFKLANEGKLKPRA